MPFFFRSEETHSTRIDQNLCTKVFEVLGVYTRHSLLTFFFRFYMSPSPLQSLLLSIALSQPLVHSLTHTQSYTCMCSFIFCGFSPVRSDDAFVLVLRFCCMNRKIAHSMAGKCRCAEHRGVVRSCRCRLRSQPCSCRRSWRHDHRILGFIYLIH